MIRVLYEVETVGEHEISLARAVWQQPCDGGGGLDVSRHEQALG